MVEAVLMVIAKSRVFTSKISREGGIVEVMTKRHVISPKKSHQRKNLFLALPFSYYQHNNQYEKVSREKIIDLGGGTYLLIVCLVW